MTLISHVDDAFALNGPTFNEVYSSLSTRRRYEVWFLRFGLADGAGAWWFRYLLLNPGQSGCLARSRLRASTNDEGLRKPPMMPVQIWATWFPRGGQPQTFIRGFPTAALDITPRGHNPFHFRIGNNQISENACSGDLDVDAHKISWDIRYRSSFRTTLSNKGWIGFSRTPHSDAVFSGRITFDDHIFEGDPLGFGAQGHNCGYRHRGFWRWAHAYFPGTSGPATTLEALVYDMPFGLVFRKAVLWHDGAEHVFRNLQEITTDPDRFLWNFRCSAKNGLQLEATFDGTSCSLHRLPYLKTDCSGSFDVTNNSLATAVVCLRQGGAEITRLETSIGAVLERAGLNAF